MSKVHLWVATVVDLIGAVPAIFTVKDRISPPCPLVDQVRFMKGETASLRDIVGKPAEIQHHGVVGRFVQLKIKEHPKDENPYPYQAAIGVPAPASIRSEDQTVKSITIEVIGSFLELITGSVPADERISLCIRK